MGKSLVSLFFLTHSVDLNDELPFALNQVANRISSSDMAVVTLSQKNVHTYFLTTDIKKINRFDYFSTEKWFGSRVVSVDSGAEGPGFKSQPRRCRVTVLGKLFTSIVPLFTKQRYW